MTTILDKRMPDARSVCRKDERRDSNSIKGPNATHFDATLTRMIQARRKEFLDEYQGGETKNKTARKTAR